jgi:hypothetical protein
VQTWVVCTASNPMNHPTPLADQFAAVLERMRQADERQQRLTAELLARTRQLLAELED